MCSNDTKSCYDKILHSEASMALQRLGLSEGPETYMFTTNQHFQYHIRTAFGDSETFMTNTLHTLFQRIGQCNGDFPTIWVEVSTPLLNILKNAKDDLFFESPLSLDKHHFLGFAFIDDTDLVPGNLNDSTVQVKICRQI